MIKAIHLEEYLLEWRNENHHKYKPWVWPRDPEMYQPTDHYQEQLEIEMRHLDEEIVDDCISEGEIFPASGHNVIFRRQVFGVSFYAIVGYRRSEDQNFRVTAYPYLYDNDSAMSDESPYTTQQVKDFDGITTEYLMRDYIRETMKKEHGLVYKPFSIEFST